MAQDIVELKNTEINSEFNQLPAAEKIKILSDLSKISKEFSERVKIANVRKRNADK